MIFGALSEKEVQSIGEILHIENIKFKVQSDIHALSNNDKSMQNNLRHLNSPSISTNVLSIEISEDAFEAMSETVISKLLEYGITNNVPTELDFQNENFDPQEVSDHLLKGNKKIIGVNFLHQLILWLVVFIVGYLTQKYIQI